MESDRRLNRWGLTFTPAVINRLRKVAIYGQPQLSLEHQAVPKDMWCAEWSREAPQKKLGTT